MFLSREVEYKICIFGTSVWLPDGACAEGQQGRMEQHGQLGGCRDAGERQRCPVQERGSGYIRSGGFYMYLICTQWDLLIGWIWSVKEE